PRGPRWERRRRGASASAAWAGTGSPVCPSRSRCSRCWPGGCAPSSRRRGRDRAPTPARGPASGGRPPPRRRPISSSCRRRPPEPGSGRGDQLLRPPAVEVVLGHTGIGEGLGAVVLTGGLRAEQRVAPDLLVAARVVDLVELVTAAELG